MNRFALAVAFSVSLLALPSISFAAEHKVSISGFKFMPASLGVAVGDTVTFTNNDGAPHTATGSGFDTGTLKKGQSKSVTISAAGNHAYKCKFHPAMTGSITAQ